MPPSQVKAIAQIQPPVTKKQIQTVTKKLAALNIFISRYLDSLRPFFIELKNTSSKGCGLECDRSFHSIKEYIASPISLSQLVDGEELFLYLAA